METDAAVGPEGIADILVGHLAIEPFRVEMATGPTFGIAMLGAGSHSLARGAPAVALGIEFEDGGVRTSRSIAAWSWLDVTGRRVTT